MGNNLELIETEFEAFKLAMWKCVSDMNTADVGIIWRKLYFDNAHILFPNIMQLVYVTFLIPVHTSQVERGFSVHRVIRNRLTNRLKIMTLDSLMRIKLLAKKADMADTMKAFDLSGAEQVEFTVLKEGIDDDEPDCDWNGNDDSESEQEAEDDPWIPSDVESEEVFDAEAMDVDSVQDNDVVAGRIADGYNGLDI